MPQLSMVHSLSMMQSRYVSFGVIYLCMIVTLVYYIVCVQVENDIAFNTLIETSSMESTCLVDNVEMAERDCFRGSGGNLQMQQYVKGAFDVSGGYTSVNNGNKFFRAGNSRQTFTFGVNASTRLIEVCCKHFHSFISCV